MTPEQRRAKERARDRRRYQRLKADPERYAAHLEYMREYNRAYRAAKKAAREADNASKRCDVHAQWEIRELAEATVEAVRGIGEEYAAIVAMWEEAR